MSFFVYSAEIEADKNTSLKESDSAVQHCLANPTNGSFRLQYTTLMLIILTFMVGSFIRPGGMEPQPATGVPFASNRAGLSRSPIATVELERVYQGGRLLKESVESAALVDLMQSHDLFMHLEILVPSARISDLELIDALMMLGELKQHFEDLGIPPKAFRIKGSIAETGSIHQGRAMLFKLVD